MLRQFADDLIHVYYTRMDKHGHTSDVRNLGETLESYYGLGSIAAEPVEHGGRRKCQNDTKRFDGIVVFWCYRLAEYDYCIHRSCFSNYRGWPI